MFLPQDQPIAASEGGCPGAPVTKKQGGGPEASIASKNRLHYLTSPRFPRSRRLAGFPQPADHTPSGRPRPAPPALRSVPLPLHSASLTSLRSWRLPGLLLLSGISDDHDRLGTRRSSSAGSARRAVLRHRASSRPLGGGQSVAIGPGRRDRQVSLRPVLGGVGDLLGCGANVETAVASQGHAEQARAPAIPDTGKNQGDVLQRPPGAKNLARRQGT